jgi:hypothetical protein
MRAEIISALGAFPKGVYVKTKGDANWRRVTAICNAEEGFQMRVDSKDWKPLTQIVQYTTDTA